MSNHASTRIPALLVRCALVVSCVSASADDRQAVAGVDFTNDIVPILTKLECNSGGCHGKATGRGGFKLSLFGMDARLDFHAITRDARGRRVFPAAPDYSLLLLKPAAKVSHAGGRRIEDDSPEYALLRRWVDSGMPWGVDDGRRLTGLEIVPAEQRLQPGQEAQIKATAIYSDASRRDVTRLVRFRSNDPSIATVDEHGRVGAETRTGGTAIVALYQGAVGVSRILVPRPEISDAEKRSLDEFGVRNFIDGHIVANLRQLRVPPSDVADDGSFLRRATLQIAGRLPTLEETRTFLAAEDPDKRDQLVSRLLASSDYADHFAQKWCDLLRVKRRGQKDRIAGTAAFHRWVRNAVAGAMPYDRFVRGILTASGNVTVNPPAQWYAEVRYLDRYVDDTAQIFLGLRIGCARCHHHPFEKFSQEDYYGLAAFFARVARKGGSGVAERRANETVYVKAAGHVKHPVTGAVVPPHGLGGEPLEIPAYADPREHLVDWMIDPANPYFARALVNRLWAHFFGRGLVDPMDDMRVTNPASNEPLLDELARRFVESGYDVKHIIRLICASETYRLRSEATDANLDETRYHSRFYPRRLASEVLLDAIDQATGVKTRFGGLPVETRAIQLPDEGYSNQFLRVFGRPPRESACECERVAEPSLSQSLFAMNDRFILDKVMAKDGLAARLAAEERNAEKKVRELFLRTLVRQPDVQELADALEYLASEKDAKTAYGNLLWALINTKEFLYVH